jgi:hypothetical protein
MMHFVVVGGSNERLVIQVTCVVCDKPKQLTVTSAQALELDRPDRRNIQEVLPDVPRAQRELLITGTCGDCWSELFPPLESSHPNRSS